MSFFHWIVHPRRYALLCAVALFCVGTRAGAEEPIKLAVFPFELKDFSAAGATTPDARDAEYLEQSTEEAKKWLSQSGRYTLVDTAGAQDDPARNRTMQFCQGCAGPIAKKLGADQAMIGLITRVSRTEYTVLTQVYDANSEKPVARFFSGMMIGADYSWSRAVKSLMKKKVLAAGQ